MGHGDGVGQIGDAEQLRNSEVEELQGAIAGDQDVGGLQVAVDDEVLVSGVHCRADTAKQGEPLADGKPVPFAVLVDRHAVDVLHDKVWNAIVRRPAVQQPGDVAVVQPRQDLALGLQPIVVRPGDEAGPDELDGDLLLIVVAALGEVDVAHAAAAQTPQQPPGPQNLAGPVDGPLSAQRIAAALIRGYEAVVAQNAMQRARIARARGFEVRRAFPRPELIRAGDNARDIGFVEGMHRGFGVRRRRLSARVSRRSGLQGVRQWLRLRRPPSGSVAGGSQRTRAKHWRQAGSSRRSPCWFHSTYVLPLRAGLRARGSSEL